jgi:hypothetical protein
MGRVLGLWALVAALWCWVPGSGAHASTNWIQLEAKRTLPEAIERARVWANREADVGVLLLPSGWYGVALGPAPAGVAAARLQVLRDAGRVPSDAYLAEASAYLGQVWPPGAGEAPPQTAAEAEAARDIQRALAWFGHYRGPIDGAIGPASRRAKAAWQAAQGLAETGELGPEEVERLVDVWRAEREAAGMAELAVADAGIVLDVPMAWVAFDRIAPPLVLYGPADSRGLALAVLSLADGPEADARLAAALGTLGVLLPTGWRAEAADWLALAGGTDGRRAVARVMLIDGTIRGFVLGGPETMADDLARVAGAMQSSLAVMGSQVLSDAVVPVEPALGAALAADAALADPLRIGAGLAVGSGVLTLARTVLGCGRIEVGDGRQMRVLAAEGGPDLALLVPVAGEGRIQLPRLGSATLPVDAVLRVAGFVHSGRAAPPLTVETAVAASGPDGRWITSTTMLPTDGGAGVFDGAGALVAMVDGEGHLLPAAQIAAWVARMTGPAAPGSAAPAGEAQAQPLRVLCLP